MNTPVPNSHAISSNTNDNLSVLSMETRDLISLGERNNWGFQLLGRAPLPDAPVRLGDWLLVPAQEDSSPIPPRSLEKIQAIFAAGFRPQGFVLVHEAPRLLSAPASVRLTERKDTSFRFPDQSLFVRLDNSGTMLVSGLAAFSGLAALAVSAVSFFGALVLPASLLAGALLLDPILVAVTQDGYWIEIDRWWLDGGSNGGG